jgi:LysM repeat protein
MGMDLHNANVDSNPELLAILKAGKYFNPKTGEIVTFNLPVAQESPAVTRRLILAGFASLGLGLCTILFLSRNHHSEPTVNVLSESENPGRTNVVTTVVSNYPIVVTPSTVATTTSTNDVGTNSYTIYSVKSGDTLNKIAADFHTTVKALRGANNLRADSIKVGQKLNIPKTSILPPKEIPLTNG